MSKDVQSSSVAVCVYKSINNLFPVGLKSLFEPSHKYMHITLEVAQTILFSEDWKHAARKSFSYRGAVLWNGLPDETKTEPSITSFNNSLRVLNFDSAF